MYISKVSLVNYRNFASAKFEFNKGINTIIGENGSGKTNLFKAIRLLLEDSSLHYAYKLKESDFNRALGKNNWRGHWIIISIEFDEISDDEAIQSLFIHGFGAVQTGSVDKASYNLFFRPKADIRQKLSDLDNGDHESMNEILDGVTVEDNYEVFFTGKSNVDFNDPQVYKELVGDFEKVEFPSAIDASKFGTKIPHQLSISKEISFTFIQALRDVVSSFHNNRTNPLLGLLKEKSGEIEVSEYEPINDMVTELNSRIEDLKDVQQIKNDIDETIRSAVGHTYSPSVLSIKSSLPDEADKLLQSLKLFIGEPNEEHEGSIHELSLGGANLIFLTLKLLEFKYQKSKDVFANFLLIEEPEAHLHTHIQKTLFEKLDYDDTQIIYSTHSTHISEVSNVENINILAKKKNYAESYQPSKGLSETNIMHVQRYLDAVRTNLLFAKGVLLVEGDAEEILVPLLFKSVYGVSLDELGISLINVRSTGFENVAQLFHDDRIKRRCSIITDLDDAICDTNINDGDSDKLIKYKKSVAASKKAGLERKERIEEFANDNLWIKSFYAKYTFEIDFINSGNEYEVKETIEDVYKDQGTKDTAKKELDSKDVAIVGKRILTMANSAGKGWYAIILGNYIEEWTIVPSYILKAIVHAKDEWSTSVISSMIKFRFDYNNSNKTKSDTTNFEFLYENLDSYSKNEISLNDFYITVEDEINDSQLTDLLKELI